jgi:hypothetical protein
MRSTLFEQRICLLIMRGAGADVIEKKGEIW